MRKPLIGDRIAAGEAGGLIACSGEEAVIGLGVFVEVEGKALARVNRSGFIGDL
ncbi:hypothetical protein PhaeoP75_04480 (plasmid) [Phaeobacter gallaeciensis]|uniref:Uncharacterized protein n=1 Tax=Phaeobacter gallaeciensis TaxID=60890 RepID=A0AAC9ZE04_9RHOB|nr:hypothetical protein PhaeoP75_04480 [Phaeobacter gallaeciensis]ATF08355.1 hypothetical protein PhaeoP63_04325 [Phaeobacter gallaeciensis]